MVIMLYAAVALLGGASATALINAFARRKVTRAEAESLVIGSADKMMNQQQEQIDRGDKERVRMEAQILALREEISMLRVELRTEREQCSADLAEMRSELVSLALLINPQGETT
jgi:predicted RNase H-like nuclease (RuvC/YqgF family)